MWDGAEVPAHLQIQLRVVDAAGRELAAGRDLAALRAQLGEAAQLSFAQAGPALEQHGLKSWQFGDLPETLTTVRDGQRLTGYPALVDDTDSVSIALLDTRAAADASMRAGVVRLLRIALKSSLAAYEKGGSGFAQAAMQLKTTIPTDRLLADVLDAVCDRAFVGDDPLPRTQSAFAEQARRARTRLPAVAEGAFRLLAAIAAAHHALGQRMGASPPALARPVAEVRRRRDALVYPGFFRATPWAQAGAFAAVPDRAGPPARQMAGRSRARCPAFGYDRKVVGAVPGAAGREAPDGGSGGGAREISLVAGRALGLAFRTGTENPVSRVLEAAGKGLGGHRPLTTGAGIALSPRLSPW